MDTPEHLLTLAGANLFSPKPKGFVESLSASPAGGPAGEDADSVRQPARSHLEKPSVLESSSWV